MLSVSKFSKLFLSVFMVSTLPGWADIMPPNDLHLQDRVNSKSANLTEEDFKAVVARAENFYAPIVRDHGATLNINADWEDSTVNASAVQFFGTWHVNMFGGLARRPEVTKDGFALVLCHELGHHLAGYAFRIDFFSAWAANEGQADYFATQSCARELWKNDDAENAKAKNLVPAKPKAACDDVWSTEKHQNLCYRIALASKSLADLLAAMKETKVSFDERDESVVEETFNEHPEAQCRLDTYLAGGLCVQDFDKTVIPGKEGGRGENSQEAENASALQTCTTKDNFVQGVRPTCWFAPLNG